MFKPTLGLAKLWIIRVFANLKDWLIPFYVYCDIFLIINGWPAVNWHAQQKCHFYILPILLFVYSFILLIFFKEAQALCWGQPTGPLLIEVWNRKRDRVTRRAVSIGWNEEKQHSRTGKLPTLNYCFLSDGWYMKSRVEEGTLVLFEQVSQKLDPGRFLMMTTIHQRVKLQYTLVFNLAAAFTLHIIHLNQSSLVFVLHCMTFFSLEFTFVYRARHCTNLLELEKSQTFIW